MANELYPGQIGEWKKIVKKYILIEEEACLYKDELVPGNCSPSYLYELVRIEAGKLNK